jgi:hypothetical protein
VLDLHAHHVGPLGRVRNIPECMTA